MTFSIADDFNVTSALSENSFSQVVLLGLCGFFIMIKWASKGAKFFARARELLVLIQSEKQANNTLNPSCPRSVIALSYIIIALRSF